MRHPGIMPNSCEMHLFVGLSHVKQKYWCRSENNSWSGKVDNWSVRTGYWNGKAIRGHSLVSTLLKKKKKLVQKLVSVVLIWGPSTTSSFVILIDTFLSVAVIVKVHLEDEGVNGSEGSCHIVCLYVTRSGFSKNCYSWIWWFGKSRTTTWRNL